MNSHLKDTSFLLLLILCVGFVKDKKTYQIECNSLTSDGYISLNIWNPKESDKYTETMAKKNAIHAILFTGIAGNNGCTTQKPLLSNLGEIKLFDKISRKFFRQTGEWIRFTRESTVTSFQQLRINNKMCTVYNIFVAKNQLRKYLEEKQIIKPLNTGF